MGEEPFLLAKALGAKSLILIDYHKDRDIVIGQDGKVKLDISVSIFNYKNQDERFERSFKNPPTYFLQGGFLECLNKCSTNSSNITVNSVDSTNINSRFYSLVLAFHINRVVKKGGIVFGINSYPVLSPLPELGFEDTPESDLGDLGLRILKKVKDLDEIEF